MTDSSVAQAARRARTAANALATATRAAKDKALLAMADALVAGTPEILAGNEADVAAARAAGTAEALIDRLTLTAARVAGMADGLRQTAALPDPVGEVVRGSTLPNGLELRQLRVPFGVVGIIYEARPNVTADAAGLALKSGNAVLLRGSSSAARSNAAIVAVLREAVGAAGDHATRSARHHPHARRGPTRPRRQPRARLRARARERRRPASPRPVPRPRR